MKIRTILAAGLLALLAGCGASLTSGYVVDKRYNEASQWLEMKCVAYDDTGQCKTRMPVWHDVPESWEICVEQNNEQDWWDVDQATFNQTNIGDWVERSES